MEIKRIFRFYIATIIIAIGFIVVFPQGVIAESGTLNISAATSISAAYNSGGGTGQGRTLNMSKMLFYSAGYNKVTKVEMTYTSGATFLYEANSSTFTLEAPNTGSGTASYSRTDKKMTLYFFDTTIISSPVSMIWANPIYTQITVSDAGGGVGLLSGAVVGVNNPVLFPGTNTALGAQCTLPNSCSIIVQVSNAFYNTYDTTYNSGIVTVSIGKSMSSVASKIYIENLTANKLTESAFNTAGFNYSYIYDNGLVLKMYDLSGNFDYVTVNSTSVTPVTPVYTSGTIAFNQTAYAKTATVNFSTSIISNYNASKAYYFKLFKYETTELVGVSGVNPAIINTFHVDPNIFIDYKGRIKVYLYEDTTVLSFATAYYGSTQTTPNGTTGNFTIHNSIPILKTLPAVIQEQNINITYNLSTDGFLRLVKGSTTWTYDLDAGTRVNQLLYVPTDMVTGDYIAHLMYYDIFTFQDTTLQSKGISILPIQNISLSCDKSTYLQGETIRCNGYLNESGYAAITFPPSKKTNKTLSGPDIFNIVTNENSETGTYFVTVVGVSGITLVVQVQLIRNVIATPTIPIDPNVTAPLSITCTGDSVLDATACLSEQILGLNPGSDGSYSDIEMKNTGNKLFSTLLLLCLVLLGVGIYKKFTESNKRK